jgi:ariadne-1
MAETFALGCGHRYCKDCYKGFLEATIKDGARSIYCHCPAPDCEVIVHEDAFRTLVSEEQFARYLLFLKRSFVDDNPTVKWCPFPGCTSAVRVERTGRQQPVACVTCGNSFCFVCCDADKGDHNPVTCESLDAWIAKGEDESENVKWMIANTKKCPKCRSPIEKDGGCMHMTCHGCRHDFCWMCRGDWSEHGSATGGYYSCNKYDASSAKAEDSAADAVKTDLEYYMFYFHRFDSHRIGLRDTIAKARALSQFQIELATNFEVRTQDTEFLNEAFAQLQQNKRVLMHSYIMGFSLKKGDASKNLFEYLQEDLEKYTNALSDMCDKTIDDIEGYDSFMKWKEEVANYTRVTAKFLDGFVQGAVENDWT